MIVIDYDNKKEYNQSVFPEECKQSNSFFISCKPSDMQLLYQYFDLDESTVLECMDIDENIRFTAFDGYDFASLVHVEVSGEEVYWREYNMYISSQLMILVSPDHNSKHLTLLEQKVIETARAHLYNPKPDEDVAGCFNQLFYTFFNILISHFSVALEKLEDKLQEVAENFTERADEDYFDEVHDLRKKAYSFKKVLRALSYIGTQIMCNENGVLSKKKMFLFRNIDTRLRKLYDFSESVYDLSTEVLNTYDSMITKRTNDIINKLTFITLIFGPLTVITGIYGMNFKFMPELEKAWAYPIVLVFMLAISLAIYMFLRKKKWL